MDILLYNSLARINIQNQVFIAIFYFLFDKLKYEYNNNNRYIFQNENVYINNWIGDVSSVMRKQNFCVMRKQNFCVFENKDADQLCSN